MRVTQINTVYESGSTGRTTKELHDALLEKGIESFVIFGVGKRRSDSHIFRSQTKFEYIINNFFSRLLGIEGFLAFLSTHRIIKFLKIIKSDIVHLRNLHGHYVNIPKLFKYLRKENCKVVMSLHDLWMFTGACPSPYLHNCEKWKTRCSNCPAKHDYPSSWLFDFSKRKQLRKQHSLLSIKDKLTVVGVSQWTKKMVDVSNLGLATTFIYNWIDVNKFFPEKIKNKSSQIELLCVSAVWEKNSEKYNNLLFIANALPPEYHITMVGHCDFNNKRQLPKNISALPLSDIDNLITLYSRSDLFLHLSHSDTFGKVIAESLACGTPVIAFDVTAMSEMIENGCGFKVKPFDLNQYINAIKSYKKKDSHTILKCRESCLKRFSFENITKTVFLYEEILNEH